jgi:hypothetical protein
VRASRESLDSLLNIGGALRCPDYITGRLWTLWIRTRKQRDLTSSHNMADTPLKGLRKLESADPRLTEDEDDAISLLSEDDETQVLTTERDQARFFSTSRIPQWKRTLSRAGRNGDRSGPACKLLGLFQNQGRGSSLSRCGLCCAGLLAIM